MRRTRYYPRHDDDVILQLAGLLYDDDSDSEQCYESATGDACQRCGRHGSKERIQKTKTVKTQVTKPTQKKFTKPVDVESRKQHDEERDQRDKSKKITPKSTSSNKELPVDVRNKDAVIARLDMAGVDANNIHVKSDDNKRQITVTATRVIRTLFGPMRGCKQRVVDIPSSVDPRRVHSYLSSDGQLVIAVKGDAKSADKDIADTTSDSKQSAAETAAETGHATSENMQLAAETESQEADVIMTSAEGNDDVPESQSSDRVLEQAPAEDKPITEVQSDDDVIIDEAEVLDAVTDRAVTTSGDVGDATTDTDPTDDTNTALTSTEDNQTLAEVRLPGFKPDDVQIHMSEDNKNIEVSARHEEKSEHGRFVQSVFRSFPAPEGFELADLRQQFDDNGVLSLTAPKTA